MTTLVERLRGFQNWVMPSHSPLYKDAHVINVMERAADRIEQLESERREIEAEVRDNPAGASKELQDIIKRQSE